MDANKIVRLFDKDGKHRLTILECFDDSQSFDLAKPSGKVLYCEKKKDGILTDIAECFADVQEIHPAYIINVDKY